MKLAVVVQRYGAEINGGAEQHARYVAEHLRGRHDVEVLTTCARDYVTWRNDLPAGVETINSIPVRRFPVKRERDPEEFGRLSHLVFEKGHSLNDELAWLESEGPTSPELIRFIRESTAYDYFIFFSFRYYHSYFGVRSAANRAILVPTAERDPAVGLGVFGPVFRGVRALMYNSFEERRMIQSVAGNHEVPGVVVGIGSDVPERTDAARFRRAFDVQEPYIIYVGRVDENKGCKELFTFFLHYLQATRSQLTLVVIGKTLLPIPDHPQLRHLGFLDDRDKFDGMAGAEALVMPSYYESLSMVALEAWALGRPVLANGKCEVLRGQCIRSNAGLYYENYAEFAETLAILEHHRLVKASLGRNGRDYFNQHYAWPVIERKYDTMLEKLGPPPESGGALEPLPGWFARRRRDRQPSGAVLASVPSGPVLPSKRPHPQRRPATRAAG